MHFHSIQFFVFFIVVTLAYFQLSWRGRWMLLLAASCYFYMVFKPVYLLILFGTIVIDYFAGIWLEKETDQRNKKILLIISLLSNIGILAFFKYYDFLGDSFNNFLNLTAIPFHIPPLDGLLPTAIAEWMVNGAGRIILPIGLSFHTFQAMSYTIEVYRGNQPAERHFGIYALYVMFYPQLVAGPIERPQNMLHQFHSYFKFDFEEVKSGLMQMAFGFFKKIVIADRLALVVSNAYDNPQDHNGLTFLVATFFFSFQIYCDFSGYSDIAIGAGRVMGFKLMDNFNRPYEAKSISDFWARWHISLSTWFRDYLYIPLGGNRKGEVRRQFNLFTVFLVSGLWHGASWNYVIWGALHGIYSVIGGIQSKLFKKAGLSLPDNFITATVNRLVTFVLVMFAWVFFRNLKAPISQAFEIIRKMLTFSWSEKISTPLNPAEMWFSVGLIVFLLVKEHYSLVLPTRNTVQFLLLFSLTALATYFFGVFTANQFIYFQF